VESRGPRWKIPLVTINDQQAVSCEIVVSMIVLPVPATDVCGYYHSTPGEVTGKPPPLTRSPRGK
jgi:hypothetical protein